MGVDKFYKRKGEALTEQELNSLFDGGDVYGLDLDGSFDYYLIRSYRYGAASCYQEAINVYKYHKYVRKTSDSGVTWSDWVKV